MRFGNIIKGWIKEEIWCFREKGCKFGRVSIGNDNNEKRGLHSCSNQSYNVFSAEESTPFIMWFIPLNPPSWKCCKIPLTLNETFPLIDASASNKLHRTVVHRKGNCDSPSIERMVSVHQQILWRATLPSSLCIIMCVWSTSPQFQVSKWVR